MLKRFALLLVLVLAGICLHAQTGLYGLFYDALLSEADSILVAEGFEVASDNVGNMIHYYPVKNDKVDFVTLVMNPDTHTLAGWLVQYNKDNTEEEDNYVFKQLTKMHFDWFKNYEETGQIVWFLSKTRTVHMVYREDGSLTVLYYDSKFEPLFTPR